MKLILEPSFDLSQADMLELLMSQKFYEDRFEMDGISDYTITRYESDEQQVEIDIERQIELKEDKLPGFIKKIASGTITVHTKIHWYKENLSGVHEVKAAGIPIKVTILTELIDDQSGGCINKTMLEVSAKIPLLGKRLEKFIMPKIERGAQNDFKKMRKYLAKLAKH